VDSKTSHLLVQTRSHEVVIAGSITHAYRTVSCTARIAERIVNLLRTFLNWIMVDHGICEVEYMKARHVGQRLGFVSASNLQIPSRFGIVHRPDQTVKCGASGTLLDWACWAVHFVHSKHASNSSIRNLHPHNGIGCPTVHGIVRTGFFASVLIALSLLKLYNSVAEADLQISLYHI